MLEEKILNDFKEAMKNKDKLKVSTLSFLRSQLKNVAIGQKKDKLEDSLVIDVIRKQIKQREDSIEKFNSADRQDLAKKEMQELEIIKVYLPPELSSEQLESIIDEIISEIQAKDMKDMGKVMKEAKEKTEGRVDNKTLSEVVRKKLSS